MRNLVRRLQKLEERLTDATGLVPHSEAWFEYWEDKFVSSMDGEDGTGGDSMKTIIRRVGLLEGRLVPKGNAASQRVAGLLRERRRRRLEANGQPFDDSSRGNLPTAPGGCLRRRTTAPR